MGNFGLQRTRAVLIVNPVDVTRIRRLAEAPLLTGMERGTGDTIDSRVQLLAVGRLVHLWQGRAAAPESLEDDVPGAAHGS